MTNRPTRLAFTEGTMTEEEERLAQRMSQGRKGKIVQRALADEATRDLIRDVLRLDFLEQPYLLDILDLGALGWTLTRAGTDGLWAATSTRDGTTTLECLV